MNLTELVQMSNQYGSDPEMVLAGGGNTSLKEKGRLYVKCSGTRLADITVEGFAEMDRNKLAAALDREYPVSDKEREAAFLSDMMAAVTAGSAGKRPSVESLLHSLFPQKYVLHVHPALVNGLTCGRNGEQIARELFGDSLIWIPICQPGYMLAVACAGELDAYKKRTGRDASLVAQQNHGIFFAADTTREIGELVAGVLKKLRARALRTPDMEALPASPEAETLRARFAALYGGTAVTIANREILRLSASLEAAAPLMLPFTPDHIVYCKAYPLYAEDAGALESAYKAYIAKNGFAPKIAIVRGIGAFAAGKDIKDAETAALLFADSVKVAVYAENFGGALPMPDIMVQFIIHWEAESYRQNLDSKR
jgi:rhamnose utilization protein RhaD (predicted bifunctional aldolase and dehydrogenase)